MNMKSDIKKSVHNSIEKAVNYLLNNQHEDGSVHLGNETRWQVWETANALLAVNTVDKTQKTFLNKATTFLLTAQRDDGSFYYTPSLKPDEYCMETTSVCILALATQNQDIHKGITFLLKKQCQDGSWEIGTPGIIKRRFWPSITGFVLNTLLQLEVSSDKIPKGIDYLLKTQQKDGSWGSNWVYYDTPYYPIHIILSALKLYGLEDTDQYLRAVKFVKENQLNDGSWDEITTDKPRPSVSLRTVLALYSLLVSPEKTNMSSIEKGITWLIQEQKNNGCWDGGYFVGWPGKKEDIYTTSMAISVLKKYISLHAL
ncbi:MAG: prenyltransferase/squalene oxidase repeat-containing protein [Candidatus Thermoplasmatota archaeon]